MARLLRWIEVAKTHPTEWDLPAAGAMAIGNLAQSDARATLLVGMPTVIEVLVDLVNSDKSGFQYAAIGTIKNLAICEQNKAVLLTSVNMVPALMLALNSPQGVIQYLAASTIRSLCINQQPDTVKLIAKADGLFSRLAHLGTQEDQAVRYEATRAVANVVRYGQCVPDGVGDCIPQLVVMAAAESPLLVLEALVTLARLAANADLRKQVAETTALDVATEIAGSEGKSAEMVCNAISLIGALHTDADSQYSDAISGLLADLVKSDDATVAAHAAKMAAI